jgi:hypothetical protein
LLEQKRTIKRTFREKKTNQKKKNFSDVLIFQTSEIFLTFEILKRQKNVPKNKKFKKRF